MQELISKCPEDEALLEALKNGGDKVAAEVFVKYENDFVRFLRSNSFNISVEEAKEAYIVAFADFWLNIKYGKLQSPLKACLKTYLFKVGYNKYLKERYDKYHKKTDVVDDMVKLGDILALQWESYDPKSTLKNKIWLALEMLDKVCREIIIKTYFEEKDGRTIKEELLLPSEEAVRKRRFDCKKKLKKLLEGSKNDLLD